MPPRLLAQLAWVFERDATRLAHEYEWPPVQVTPEEAEEADRLRDVANELMTRAAEAGQYTGTDYCFGTDE